MDGWLQTTIASACTLIVTLTVTFLFNKFVNLPKTLKAQKAYEKQQGEKLKQENACRDQKIAQLEAAINALPNYRAQSIQVQQELKATDASILAVCNEIKAGILDNQNILNSRLDRLEKREKNAIRAKLLDEYRLFTDETKNPMLAWSEMEHHAFFELVRDYEDLDGNDYVHSTVLPAMNELAVIFMSDKVGLAKLMASRKL